MPKDRLLSTEETFPLEINFCNDCAHLQLSHVIDPEVLFRHYVYVSGTSPVMVKHLEVGPTTCAMSRHSRCS